MVQLKEERNLPWVEKYRPSTLDELISHKDIVTTSTSLYLLFMRCSMIFTMRICAFSVNKFIDEDKLPHLLLYGPPGTGKTTTILAAARRMYEPKQFHSMVLEVLFFKFRTAYSSKVIFDVLSPNYAKIYA